MQNSEESKLRRQQLLEERDKTSFRRYFTSVGFALLAAFTALPFTRNKVMMQCRPEMLIAGREPFFTSPLSAFSHIRKNEGKTKFMRGFLPFMSFTIPYTLARQSASTSFSKDLDEKPSPIAAFSRGFAATTISSVFAIILNPLSIAATKMMADTKPAKRAIYEYHGATITLRSVYAFGGLSKLFVGSIPFWLHNTVHFSSLYAFTSLFGSQSLDLHPALVTLLSSILAVLTAHPIDTIRSRMQYRLHTQVTDYIPEYKGMLDCSKQIWANEGIRGFYRGATGSVGVFAIATLWLMVASSRSHKLRGREAKNEALVQRRMEHSQAHRTKFFNQRRAEEKFYGLD